MTNIEYSAFDGCTGITSITIPATVTEMGNYVFNYWTSSQTIHVPFKEGALPQGWSSSWQGYACEANIEYLQ